MRPSASQDVYQAIADPTRRRILELLAAEERTVSALVDSFDVSQPAVSQHLAVLRAAGLVESRRDGRHRVYRLHAAPIQMVADWTAFFERFWEEKLGALEAYLDRNKQESPRG